MRCSAQPAISWETARDVVKRYDEMEWEEWRGVDRMGRAEVGQNGTAQDGAGRDQRASGQVRVARIEKSTANVTEHDKSSQERHQPCGPVTAPSSTTIQPAGQRRRSRGTGGVLCLGDRVGRPAGGPRGGVAGPEMDGPS